VSDIRDLRESIDQLTASMWGGWDWPSFVSTLVATLAGAGVAAGVAWLILRRERSDRYRERMYGAMVALAVRYPPPHRFTRSRAERDKNSRGVIYGLLRGSWMFSVPTRSFGDPGVRLVITDWGSR